MVMNGKQHDTTQGHEECDNDECEKDWPTYIDKNRTDQHTHTHTHTNRNTKSTDRNK